MIKQISKNNSVKAQHLDCPWSNKCWNTTTCSGLKIFANCPVYKWRQSPQLFVAQQPASLQTGAKHHFKRSHVKIYELDGSLFTLHIKHYTLHFICMHACFMLYYIGHVTHYMMNNKWFDEKV